MAVQDIIFFGEEVLDFEGPLGLNGDQRTERFRPKKTAHKPPRQPLDYYDRMLAERGLPEAWKIAATNARILQQKLEARDSELNELKRAALGLLKATAQRGRRLERRRLYRTRKMCAEQETRRTLKETLEATS